MLLRLAQYISIIAGAATPVLVAADAGARWLQVALAALAALSVTAMSTFKWREEWVQYASAHQLLGDERLAYHARVGAYDCDRQKALAKLVARRKRISDANLEEWRQTLLRSDQPDGAKPTGGTGASMD